MVCAKVSKIESATHDAQEKSKAVDKDFAKYVSSLNLSNSSTSFAGPCDALGEDGRAVSARMGRSRSWTRRWAGK